jgi:hypothetical protein
MAHPSYSYSNSQATKSRSVLRGVTNKTKRISKICGEGKSDHGVAHLQSQNVSQPVAQCKVSQMLALYSGAGLEVCMGPCSVSDTVTCR